MNQSPIQARILDAAEKLCQTRGFNGFSFRDLADIVGIRSASVHYHFPTKSHLGKALIVRYRQRMESVIGEIERKESTVAARLKRFVSVLRAMIQREERVCLCGILAAETGTLPDEMKAELRRFFEVCEQWLADQLSGGRQRGEITLPGEPAAAARAVFATLEGAMITSRAFGDDRRLTESAQWLLGQLAPT